MKKIFLFSMLLSCTQLFAQSYSISAGTYIPTNAELETQSEITFFSYQTFEDFTIRRETKNVQSQTQNYEGRPGFYIQALQSFNINSDFKITTGLGINAMRFNYQATSMLISQETLSVDTIANNDGVNPTSFIQCDSYANSFSDFNASSGTDYSIYYLAIPLRLDYRPIELLGFSLGGEFRTPLKSAVVNEFIGIDSESVGGMTICEYFLRTDEDHSGNGINNLELDISAGVQFYFADHWSVDLGVSKTISKTFYQYDENDVFFGNKKFSPLLTKLGISYYFGNGLEKDIHSTTVDP